MEVTLKASREYSVRKRENGPETTGQDITWRIDLRLTFIRHFLCPYIIS